MGRGFSLGRVILLAFVALLAGGCSVTSLYMTQLEAPAPIAADANLATVVFIRPSGYAGQLKTVIMDQAGRFLGECWGKTYFAVKMPPGQYDFVSWGEGTPALHAQVDSGKFYYVEVGTVIGAWTARARLFGVGPQRSNGPELAEWLANTKMLVPDEAAGRAYLQSRADDVASVLAKGRGSWSGYDADDRQKRSIGPADAYSAPVGQSATPIVVGAVLPAPLVAAAPAAPSPATAAPASSPPSEGPDTVYLANGGRMRGLVMEEDPKRGVTIKLIDETVRKLAPGEVKSVEYAK
jgi:hypothetical protein